MSNTHTQPWSQMILYNYKLGEGPRQRYEEDELEPDLWLFRFASVPGRVNFQIKIDTDGITP